MIKEKATEPFEILEVKKSNLIKFGETSECLVLVKFTNETYPKGKFSFQMKMKVIEVDEDGEEQSSYDDTWKLDPIMFSINDYMIG
jgi:hypothetical protein